MSPSHRLLSLLTDPIIDFCHDDRGTLSNCTLTHKSWLERSRLHLFHTITSVGKDRTDRQAHLKSIICCKTMSFPPALQYIKTVKVASSPSYQLEDAPYLAHAIRMLCKSEGLPSPSVHVSLSQFDLGDAFCTALSLVNDVVTHVKLLNISFLHADNVWLWSFLSSLPQLQHLELLGVGFLGIKDYYPPTERTFVDVPLSTLRITTKNMYLIISGLISVAGSLSYLEDFGITYQDVTQEDLPQLAEAIQDSVKCLRFSASCYPGDERVNELRPSALDISEKTIPA